MPRFLDRTHAAFLFDMDGTLLDSSAVVERVWRAWADRQGIDPEPLLAACHGVQGPDTIRRFGSGSLDVDAEAASLAEAELADVEGIVAIEGAGPFLRSLDPGSWAVVTSAPGPLARLRLSAVGLPKPAILITAEDVSHGKPDPEGFLTAAARLGVPIADCLVFEDSDAGVAAARAAGAHVAIIGGRVAAREGEIAVPDYLLT